MEDEISRISSPVEAIDFAINREWESISYYQEIKGAVPEGQRGHVNKIVSEERKHFTKLSEGKKMFF